MPEEKGWEEEGVGKDGGGIGKENMARRRDGLKRGQGNSWGK